MISYESEGCLVSSPRVSQSHGHQGSGDDGQINAGYCLIVDFRNVVDQVVALKYFSKWVFIYESN